MKNLVITIGLILICFITKAQKVSLTDFYLNQDNKEILLSWTIDAGSTCNGITIWRSVDSINYKEIGSIGGVCGSNSSSVPYNFKDKNPVLNKTNYYKLQLGSNQFSEVRLLFLEFTEFGKLIIKPNPSTDNVTLTFNNDRNAPFGISIINGYGLKVYELQNIYENNINLNISEIENGQYYLILTDSGGRIIIEKLMILK